MAYKLYLQNVMREFIAEGGMDINVHNLIDSNDDLLQLEKDGEIVLRLTTDGSFGGAAAYSGEGSYQPIAPDLNLADDAGSSDGGDPSFLAAVMGNIISADMSTDANYLAGVIGAYSITGVKATTYPAGAVLAQISDQVTEADGAVVAYVDGDGGVTKANAAFKAMCNNSTVGSGFDYGLDLYSPTHDGYLELPILKADVRCSNQVVIMNGAGAPVDGTTGDNFAGIGSMYIDRTNGDLYIQTAVISNPVWKLVTRAA